MINDILSSDIGVAGQSDFTVDKDVDQVAVTVPGASGLGFYNGDSKSVFEPGDNALLVGASINIPYGFGQGTGKCSIGIAWQDALGNYFVIPELASNSILVFPNFCHIDFPPAGLFIKCPATDGPLALVLTNIVMNVSQINVPPQLNGDVLKVQFHLQVNHTKALGVFP